MDVVEHEEHGCFGGDIGQPGGYGVEEPIALGLRIGEQRLGQAGDQMAELWNEPGELATMTAQASLRDVGDIVVQRFDERLVGHAEVLVAAAGQHHGTFFVHQGGQLGGEAGLADPWLAGEQGRPPLSRHRLLPQLGESLRLRLPPNEDPSRPD